MADQEFLASFAVDIDEAGVFRLQTVLTENRELADSLAAAFSAASEAIRSFAEELGILPNFSAGYGITTEGMSGFGGLAAGLDLSQAFTDYEAFTERVKQPISLKANASGITSAARSAMNSIRSIFAEPVDIKLRANVDREESKSTESPLKMSTGGRFSRPTEVQVAEDGDAEYIIPVKKEERAVPLLRQLLSELSPAAMEGLSDSAIADTQIKDLDSCSMGVMNRIFNRCDFSLGRSLVSDDLSSDGISATGSRQSFTPAEARMAMQQFMPADSRERAGTILSGILAAGTVETTVNQTHQNVSAPVSIQVHTSGSDPEQIGQSLYSLTERYLQRTLESAFR